MWKVGPIEEYDLNMTSRSGIPWCKNYIVFLYFLLVLERIIWNLCLNVSVLSVFIH